MQQYEIWFMIIRYSDSFVVTTFEEEKTTAGQNLNGPKSPPHQMIHCNGKIIVTEVNVKQIEKEQYISRLVTS